MAAIFADGTLICIFLTENVWISNEMLLKYVPQGLIDNKPSPVRRQPIIWTNNGPVYWRIYKRHPASMS